MGVVSKKWKTKDTIHLLSGAIESLESIKQTENRKSMVESLQKELIAELKSAAKSKIINEKIRAHEVQIKQAEGVKSNCFNRKYKGATIKHQLVKDEPKKLNSKTHTSNDFTNEAMKFVRSGTAFFLIWNAFLFCTYKMGYSSLFDLLFWPNPESYLPTIRGQLNSMLFFTSVHNIFNGVSASKCHLFILILTLFFIVQAYTI